MIRGRLRRRGGGGGEEKRSEEFFEIDPRELSGLFAAPRWLRDAGLTSWLLVGVTVLLVELVWLLSLTSTIVLPVVAGGVIAAVGADSSPCSSATVSREAWVRWSSSC